MDNSNCPICGSNSKVIFEAKGFPIRDCLKCQHRFAAAVANEDSLPIIYNDSYFFSGGGGYPNYLDEAEPLRMRGIWYSKKVINEFEPGRLLDVGSAAGFVMQGFQDSGWDCTGLEPNVSMAKHGREQLGLDLREGSFEAFASSEQFDLISMIQVAAHFYDPKSAFGNAYRHLRRGGHLLIETWDRDSWPARILGRHWAEYSPPSVLHWFSKVSLTQLLEEQGFKLAKSGRPMKRISGSHAKSLLKYRIGDQFFLKFFPDKVSIPYPPVDLFWALYKRI